MRRSAGGQALAGKVAARLETAGIGQALALLRRAPGQGDPMTASTALAGWQIRRLCAFIDDHLDEPLHTKDLSLVVQRSPGHFCRAFKRSFGETPHAYVIRCRLDRAAHLMLSSKAGLGEIALACGFSDQAHLCRLFRLATGQTPAAWRRDRRLAAEDR
ncbi:MAG: AraC family transcriptional regulator [Aliidongia sp.]